MVEELSPPRADEQRREAINFALEAIGRKLFPVPDNPLIIRGIFELKPSPLDPSCSPLIILRANKNGSVQGCFLDLETPSAEEVKKGGDSIKRLSEDLCMSHDCSPEAVRGVVVFMEPKVSLEDMGSDIRVMTKYLSPGTQFWFVEPHSPLDRKREERRKKREKKLYLRDLGLVNPRSIRSVTGFPYSTGRLPVKKRTESTTPTQAQLELISQR